MKDGSCSSARISRSNGGPSGPRAGTHQWRVGLDSRRFAIVCTRQCLQFLACRVAITSRGPLSRRLQLDIQLVNEQGDAKGAASAPARTALPRLVASAAPELRMLVASAITLHARQTTTLRDLRVYAYPLSDGVGVIGAVLIAHSTAGQRGTVPDVDFDVTSQSVVQGIEAHLRSAPVSSQNNFDKLASLGHVLDAAAAQGSDRDTSPPSRRRWPSGVASTSTAM